MIAKPITKDPNQPSDSLGQDNDFCHSRQGQD